MRHIALDLRAQHVDACDEAALFQIAGLARQRFGGLDLRGGGVDARRGGDRHRVRVGGHEHDEIARVLHVEPRGLDVVRLGARGVELLEETLDFERPNLKAHWAFGHGIHYCLGNAVARLEIKVALPQTTRLLRK